ncbi:hypothetical protein [Paraglaciecola hydrolytica]|uniref:Serine active site containing 1-like protein n=1 Tax=Paraglaciecola hydrolytica TaxID=1799789 RepID=A0A136A5P7_9ALTE|nr:hypothetical protein [Paraglaciecola hydrolytica]KXI30450.1 hypothetical protein AX660_10830 [Paraglaciecola hydrolytica]
MRFSLPWGIAACFGLIALIYLLGPYNADITFAEDQGALWYYWKLPNPSFWTHFTAWSFYTCHQIAIWWLIYSAKQSYSAKARDTATNTASYQTFGLHKVNIYALGLNLFFILLHIVQTKIFYDGLAQDVSNLSAQFSVIILLVMVMMIEHQRRGLFFGKKVKVLERTYALVKDYHGYYFAWAIIYTFWFHPIETTLGHLLGTFYTFMLMLQGSLFFTRFHRNKYWTLLLETFVLLHGALVAYASVHGESVSMFAFGFAVIFFVTQIYGLGLKKPLIYSLTLLFAVLVGFYYQNNIASATQIFRIPAAIYGGVFIMLGLFFIGSLIYRLSNLRNTNKQ